MAGRSRDMTDEIRHRVNILEVVSPHVTLRRAGKSYKGLCPFHSEKTPSFTVDPERGFFYCFGCHKGGDVFLAGNVGLNLRPLRGRISFLAPGPYVSSRDCGTTDLVPLRGTRPIPNVKGSVTHYSLYYSPFTIYHSPRWIRFPTRKAARSPRCSKRPSASLPFAPTRKLFAAPPSQAGTYSWSCRQDPGNPFVTNFPPSCVAARRWSSAP
jgi:hypothetical protein